LNLDQQRALSRARHRRTQNEGPWTQYQQALESDYIDQRIAAGQELRRRNLLSPRQDSALQELERS